MKKVLAILTSTVLYGKERANIEVYNILKKEFDCSLSVIINRKANDNLKQALANISSYPICVVNRGAKKYRLIHFVCTYVLSNIQLLYYLIKLKPNLLMMCWELSFYDYFPVLLFYKGKILYRIGDEPGLYHSLSLHRYNRFIWKNYVVRRVTRVVGNSKFILKRFAQEGRDMKQDYLIYNYPPTRKNMVQNEDRLYKDSSLSDIKFGYIGQLIELKGVHHYIECALNILARYPNVIFYIAGSLNYKPEYSNRLIKMVPERWTKNIIFLGEIVDIDLFFNNIDVLCVPSIKQEPLANVLVEAKAAGKPCIIYPTGGMPELISDGVDGFICEEANSIYLQAKMFNYIENRQLIVIQGNATKKAVVKLGLDRDTFERKWISVFRELFA